MERQWQRLKQLHGEVAREGGGRQVWTMACSESSPLLTRAGGCRGSVTTCLHCHQLLLLSCLARHMAAPPDGSLSPLDCTPVHLDRLPPGEGDTQALISVLVRCLEGAEDSHVLFAAKKCLLQAVCTLPLQAGHLVLQVLEGVKHCSHSNSLGHTNVRHSSESWGYTSTHHCNGSQGHTSTCLDNNSQGHASTCHDSDSNGHNNSCHCMWRLELCQGLLSSHTPLEVRQKVFKAVSPLLPSLAELCLPRVSTDSQSGSNSHPVQATPHPSVASSHPGLTAPSPRPARPPPQLALTFLGLLLKLVKLSNKADEVRDNDASDGQSDSGEEEMEMECDGDSTSIGASSAPTNARGETNTCVTMQSWSSFPHLQPCLEKLVHLIKFWSLTNDSNCHRIQCKKILEIFSASLWYGGKLSLMALPPPECVWLAQLLSDSGLFSESFVSALSPTLGHASFGGWQTSSSPSDSAVPDLATLRVLALLCFKVCAVLARSSSSGHVLDILSSLDCSLTKLLQRPEETTVAQRLEDTGHLKWLGLVLGEQDNFYLEALLCLLDVHLHLHRVPDSLCSERQVEAGCSTEVLLDPHCLFLSLLEWCRHSASLLVDWLASPETCFLLYLTRYLKCLLAEWPAFLAAAHCRHSRRLGHHLSNPRLQEETKSRGRSRPAPCYTGGNKVETQVTGRELPASKLKSLVDYSSSSGSESDGEVEEEEVSENGKTEGEGGSGYPGIEGPTVRTEMPTVMLSPCVRPGGLDWAGSEAVMVDAGFIKKEYTPMEVWNRPEEPSEISSDYISTVVEVSGTCRDAEGDRTRRGGTLGKERADSGRGQKEDRGRERVGDCCVGVRQDCGWQCLERPRDTLAELCGCVERLSQQGLFPYQPRPLLRLLHQSLECFDSTLSFQCHLCKGPPLD